MYFSKKKISTENYPVVPHSFLVYKVFLLVPRDELLMETISVLMLTEKSSKIRTF